MGMRLIAQISLGSLAFALAASAHAQVQAPPVEPSGNTGEQGLEDIIVVAQKRAESSQKVPVALTTVNADQLTAAGALTSTSLNTAVPGLTINSTAVYFSPRIRGIGTTAFGPGVENPVALYIDDVYYASQLTAPTDLSNVDQLTVLKGPQGTLFGRNATGGVLQMGTRNPKEGLSGEVASELDQYLTSRSHVYVTGGNDRLKGNLFVSYITQGEGWGQNLRTHNDIKKIDSDVGIRSKILFTPTETTEIKLIGDYYKRRNSMGPNNRSVPGGTYGLPGGLARSTDFLLGGPGNPVPPSYVSNNDYDATSVRDPLNKLQGGGLSLHISQDFGFARGVSITAYRKYDYDAFFDTAGLPYQTLETEFQQKGWQVSQELQLVSNDSTPLSWVIGAYYFKGKDRVDGVYTRSFGNLQNPTLPSSPIPFIGTQALDSHVWYGTESLAGFAQASYEFLPETHLTGGIRYTWEKRTRGGFIQLLVDGQPTLVPPGPGIPASGNLSEVVPGEDSVSVKRPTWRVALDHQFTRDILGYVSYNRGFKSGGYNGISGNLRDLPYQPETLDAFEVGMKSELFDRTLRINPAIFYYKYNQIQVSRFTATSTTIENGAKAELWGMNLDATWKASSKLTINGGFEWLMGAEFKSFPGAPTTTPIPIGSPPVFGAGGLAGLPGGVFNGYYGPGGVPAVGGTIEAAGNRIPFAAKFSGNIGLTYTTDVAGAEVSFNVNNAYNSGYYTEVDNRLRQKSTNILSTSITWISPDDRLQLSIFGRNLLDEHIINLFTSQAPVGDVVDYGGPPRTFGFSAKYKFGAQ